MRRILTTALVLMLAAPLAAQTTSPTGSTVPAADSDDVATIDAIMWALYDVISAPAGQARDWDRFRSLFVPEANLMPTGFPEGSAKATARVTTVEDYIEGNGPGLKERGLLEHEIGRVTERFENIAHAFSSYESRRTVDGDVFARGISSTQLMWDGERWWITNIMWRAVGPDAEIPAKYLQKRE